MTAYEVRHKASGGRFYTLADSPGHAVERVTLALEDAEGRKAWEATPAEPAFALTQRAVFDANGAIVRSLEA